MAEHTAYPFLKGHGTRNDFVLLPDHDGTIHGELSADRVRALCDRRAGIGGDGVLRVIRTAALGFEPGIDPGTGDAEWFMDYRNADGSFSEMCGNGIRVFARHLVEEGLADAGQPIPIGTRDGVKVLTVHGDQITADMGTPTILGDSDVSVGDRHWPARHIDVGNPHAVAFVDDLADAGALLEAPAYDAGVYPHGANVEFVVRRGPQHVAMRVHERGSGETMSCGTGACAVMVATAAADGAERDVDYRVDLPGGTLTIRQTSEGRLLMTGPGVIVARGTSQL
ncbi:diaminopimelate epimerase [Nocardioides salsibiostraticola]